ncbi:putative MFS family arabinose efflux permease [Neomicrococcus aestuarii]|uniref:Putative MFS family arabinose efflux permease n=1 Tax=Neomicrococcus aestuarii TaxID=556325 RepID=A0A7W8X011_9MICC|nr:MFS transporter [Neomicrococcus aestuarii]MBB5512885.1 putative MFS family arabinose efflux permease [Neomicrococcus aestuarii]
MTGSADSDFDGHRHGSTDYKNLILALFAAGVATFSQLYSLQGVLPELARNLHIEDSHAALAVSAATLGLAIAVIPWSMVADRIGRLKTMTYSIIGAVIFGLAVPWSPTFEWLLLLRLGEGLVLGGIPAVALVYLSEEVTRTHAAIAAATYVSGTTIGGLLGRLIAGPLSEFVNWRIGTFVVSCLAAVAALIFIKKAPQPRGFQHPQQSELENETALKRITGKLTWAISRPALLAIYAQGFLLMGGFVATYNYLAFRLEAPPFFVPASLASLMFTAYLAGTWSSRQAGKFVLPLGRLTVLLATLVIALIGLAITLFESIPLIIIGLLIYTAGFFGAHAVASGWIGRLATHNRAQATSLYNLFYYVGSSLFGWLIGYAFTAAGWPLLVACVAGLVALAGAIAVVLLRNQPGSAPQPREVLS